MLRSLKLIDESEEEFFPFRKLVSLTERGRRLVKTPLMHWGKILY
jgi:hypothetical protein